METSQTIGKISDALAKAQGQMKPALFNAVNPHYKSKYASLASIREACRDALSQNNIAVIQSTSVEENRVIVTTLLAHGESGEWIRDQLSLKLMKEDAQAVGSAITYARRYSLSSMIGIVADEDDDGENAVKRPQNGKSSDPKLVVVNKNKPSGKKNAGSVGSKATQSRVAKIRKIFSLSAQLGHTPDQMKAIIGQLIGLDRPIKESAEIKDDHLEMIISEFAAELVQAKKEVA